MTKDRAGWKRDRRHGVKILDKPLDTINTHW
jgi:hypothetical protein